MNDRHPPTTQEAHAAAANGMFAMMAMMAICCVGVFLLVLLIPLIGWPAGIVLALAGGAVLMALHMKFMNHGSHH